MKTQLVRVAVPVLRGKRRFHFDKGRPWSVVEHLILLAITEGAKTASQLATEGNLPRRLVVEVIIRLMRAGWIELLQTTEGTLFVASPLGKAAVSQTELPSATKRLSRWMNFVIDRVTGTLYRNREFPFFEKHVLVERAREELFVWMDPRDIQVNDSVGALVTTLFNDDEKFVSMDPAGDRLVERYGVVSVRGERVEGLPQRAPEELRRLAIEAAQHAPEKPSGATSPAFRPAAIRQFDLERPAQPRPIFFETADLILGGDEHEAALDSVIKKARYRIIVHSTFIADDKFTARKSLLFDAARRGVAVDVMWGEDDERSLSKSTRLAVNRIRQEIAATGLGMSVRVHPFSTLSHAKLLLADDGRADRLFAIVGSCNWFSSGFNSFEASVRVRDSAMIADIAEHLAELSRGADGHWTDLTNELARLATEVRRRPSPGSVRGEGCIVLGPQHAHYIRQARDDAVRRIVVTSHRFGAAGRLAVVIPSVAAAQDRDIDVRVYFGRTSGLQGEDAARMTRAAGEIGVRLKPIYEPRLHAKMLGWDDDFLVVSSQNWLSADPSEANPRKEIGIFIHSAGIARVAIERFEAAIR